ncbi:MAG: response regulator, partial [Christensenellaceae bacterium]
EYDFTGKRVLLVEDHLLNIEIAKKLLNAKHLEVEVAENGLQAIEIFAQKDDGYYNAILMDIRMPVMDGLTAAKSIRQMRKSDAKTIPIIAMTANAFDEDIEKTKAAGMNAHLAKPIEPALLYQTIQRFLNKEEAEI